VCFAKHTFSKHNLGRVTLFFFNFFGAGLDLAGPAWSLAHASDPAGKQAYVTQLTRALHCAKVINYLHTILQHLHLKQRRMVLPGEDEDEDEGIGPSVGRRIFSSSSSFQSLPLCSCVSFCWVYFFLLTLYFPFLFVFSALFFPVFCPFFSSPELYIYR
jgi:hypothetical protein